MNKQSFIKSYLHYVTRYKLLYSIFVVSVIIFPAASSQWPLFAGLFVKYSEAGDLDALLKIAYIFIGFFIGVAIFDQLIWWSFIRIANKVEIDLKNDAVKHILNLDYDYHTSRSTGKVIAKVNRIGGTFYTLVERLNYKLLASAFYFIMPIISLWFLDWRISISFITILIIAVPVLIVLMKINFRAKRDTFEPEEKLSSAVVDALTNFDTIKSFAKEKKEQQNVADSQNLLYRFQMRYASTFRIIDGAIYILGTLLISASILITINLYRDGDIDTTGLIIGLGFISSYPWRIFEFFYDLREIIKAYSDFKSYVFRSYSYRIMINFD